jgi:hypothetical protein
MLGCIHFCFADACLARIQPVNKLCILWGRHVSSEGGMARVSGVTSTVDKWVELLQIRLI